MVCLDIAIDTPTWKKCAYCNNFGVPTHFIFTVYILKEDIYIYIYIYIVKERGRNCVTWLRIPEDSESIFVNSQVTKNFFISHNV